MIQYIILGYLVFEILRLSQLADASAVKFVPPASEPSVPTAATAAASAPSSSTPPSTSTAIPSPPEQKSEVATAKSL